MPPRAAANSGAIVDMPASYFDMVRPGVMMNGYYPSGETTESVKIKPGMTLSTRIVHIKRVSAGTGISYGKTCGVVSGSIDALARTQALKGRRAIESNRGQVISTSC